MSTEGDRARVLRYEIQVQGSLDPSWSDCLGGMVVSVSTGARGPVMTTLTGSLPDQSALAGVLNTLTDLQLELLSVRQLPDEGGRASSEKRARLARTHRQED